MIKVDFPIEETLRWIEKAKGDTRRFAVETIQDLNELVVTTTPYRTGNMMGSWYASLNGQPDARSGPAGSDAVGRLNLALADLQIGDVYYAANGANYAIFVHDGTSRLAPRPWVALAIEQAPAIAEAAANRIANE